MEPADSAKNQAVRAVTLQFTAVWSRGEIDLVPEIYAEDFVAHFPAGIIRGHEGIKELVMHHRRAFPDWTETIEDLIYESNKIAVRFTSTGTNTGPNMGKPPTHRAVEISELAIYRIDDGRIAEQWVQPDTQSLHRQLYGDG